MMNHFNNVRSATLVQHIVLQRWIEASGRRPTRLTLPTIVAKRNRAEQALTAPLRPKLLRHESYGRTRMVAQWIAHRSEQPLAAANPVAEVMDGLRTMDFARCGQFDRATRDIEAKNCSLANRLEGP